MKQLTSPYLLDLRRKTDILVMERLFDDIETIDQRLRQRASLSETFAILLGIFLSIGFTGLRISQDLHPINGIDTGIFINSVHGIYEGFYYPNWSIPLFWLLSLLSSPALIFVVWNTLNILAIAFSARVFGGKSAVALLSYQLIFSLWFGQIVGVIIGGIAFYWWMLRRGKPMIAGMGAIFALIKPQMSIPILLVMGIYGADNWRDRMISAIPGFLALGLSLLFWNNWIFDLIIRIRETPPMENGSIALWQYIGAWSLLLWIPVFLVPMKPARRIILITATMSVATPYFIHNGLLLLFVMPAGWIGLGGNIGYAMTYLGWNAVKLTAIVPLLVYVWILGKAILALYQGNGITEEPA